MFDVLFLIAIGVIVGWHIPAPPWAMTALDYLKTKFGV